MAQTYPSELLDANGAEEEPRRGLSWKIWAGLLVVFLGLLAMGLSLFVERAAQRAVPDLRDLAVGQVQGQLESRTNFFMDIDGDGDPDYITQAWFIRNVLPGERLVQPLPDPEESAGEPAPSSAIPVQPVPTPVIVAPDPQIAPAQ